MTVITKTVFFSAAPDVVWEFLTKKDKLALWFHPAEADLEAGEPYKLISKSSGNIVIWGKVLEMQPHSRLVTTFCIGPFGDRESTVTWSLASAAGGTQLTLEHHGIEAAAGDQALRMFMALDKGWDEHLGDLRSSANPAAD